MILSFFRAQLSSPSRLICMLSFCSLILCGQKENNQWYFGVRAGVNFATNPPMALSNGSVNTWEGCSSISDAAGNLLFYTAGDTVYNQLHQIMANGTGLMGEKSSSQSTLIVRKPGSNNLYYIFTNDAQGSSPPPVYGFRYSIVDMSLAAGMGSVTTKNVLLHTPTCEKLAATMHCNSQDVWVVSHEHNSTNFIAYLLTSSGITTTVTSSIGAAIESFSTSADFAGTMKISVNGKKLAMCLQQSNIVQLFDFDNVTGLLSNSITLTPPSSGAIYGCEFSPDGTKLYAASLKLSGVNGLFQWDLCAGSAQAINASVTTVKIFGSTMSTFGCFGAIQLAPNGKIYVSRQKTDFPNTQQLKKLGVIHNPNQGGISCNYVDTSVFAGAEPRLSLPNLLYRSMPLPPFSFTANPVACTSVSFALPFIQGINQPGCQSTGTSSGTVLWNFGDPASGSANTSTLTNPVHNYSGNGTYTPQVSIYFSCGGGSAILTQSLHLVPADFTLTQSTICSGQSATLLATGADSYTWSGASTGSIYIVSPSVTSVYTVSAVSNLSLCTSQKTVQVAVLNSPDISASSKTICPGETAVLTASGASTFIWSNSVTTSSISVNPSVTTNYTVIGTATNICSSVKIVTVTVAKCTGITEKDRQEKLVSIFPNPDRTMHVYARQENQIFVFDGTGRQIHSQLLVPGITSIDMEPYAAGLYYVRCVFEDKVEDLFFVKSD